MPKGERISITEHPLYFDRYILVYEQPCEVITPILQVRKLRQGTA